MGKQIDDEPFVSEVEVARRLSTSIDRVRWHFRKIAVFAALAPEHRRYRWSEVCAHLDTLRDPRQRRAA